MAIELSVFDTNGTLTGNFFDLLQKVETAIPVPNLFLAKFDIPSVITDQIHDTLGESPQDGKTNINRVVDLFGSDVLSKNAGFAVCNGINTNTEKIQVNKVGSQKNGYLPISYNEQRDFDPTDLSLQFMETVISVADFIFKPWIRMVAREGGFSDNNLHTDIEILYLERHNDSGFFNFFSNTGAPMIRKHYTFYNCLPYNVDAEGIQTYTDTPQVVNKKVDFHFDRYDVKLPTK